MAERILACGACLRRAMQLLPRQKAAFQAACRPPDGSPLQMQRRFAASAVAHAMGDAPVTSLADSSSGEPTVAKAKEEARLRRIVQKQLAHMQDPWLIGQHVEATLKRDQFDEALLFTEAASRERQVVVAWNHLINYMMEKQQLKRAIKLYNDMKKRAQLPNIRTYTVLFRGCAKSQHPKLAVSEAIKHYHILMKDKRIQPNSIHLNAVLNVCGRAGDLDSMFSIVDTANDSTRAPTTFTYTTILNALRHQTLKDVKDLSPEEQNRHVNKLISRAKALWEEVIDKWRHGRLPIDEELVCSMGRVILMSPERKDKQQVFDLLEQTMGIPNMFKEETDLADDYDSKGVVKSEKNVVSNRRKMLYAQPGPNTLALVLTVLASAKLPTSGIKYWNYLIHRHDIQPDNDNWMRMFGLLKVAKASARAAELVDAVPDEFINARHYRIAMEACVRNNISPNAIKNSHRVLVSMVRRLRIPDCHTMRLYLRVALVSHHELRARTRTGDGEAARRDYGVQITDALSRLSEPYLKTYKYYFQQAQSSDKHGDGSLYNDKREVIALARNMYSAFCKVIEERMLGDADLVETRRHAARINREIQRFYSNREELEPKLRKPGPAESVDTPDLEDSKLDYRPAGDFIWDTSKRTEQTQGDVEMRSRRRHGTSTAPTSRPPGKDSSAW